MAPAGNSARNAPPPGIHRRGTRDYGCAPREFDGELPGCASMPPGRCPWRPTGNIPRESPGGFPEFPGFRGRPGNFPINGGRSQKKVGADGGKWSFSAIFGVATCYLAGYLARSESNRDDRLTSLEVICCRGKYLPYSPHRLSPGFPFSCYPHFLAGVLWLRSNIAGTAQVRNFRRRCFERG